jgi:hypothetical protein
VLADKVTLQVLLAVEEDPALLHAGGVGAGVVVAADVAYNRGGRVVV